MGEKDGGGGPLRIDSRPSRWSVTREAERTREKVGKNRRSLSLFLSYPEDRSTENTEAKGTQECWPEREKERKGGESKRGREEGKKQSEQGRGWRRGRGVVERWKVEKRRQ